MCRFLWVRLYWSCRNGHSFFHMSTLGETQNYGYELWGQQVKLKLQYINIVCPEYDILQWVGMNLLQLSISSPISNFYSLGLWIHLLEPNLIPRDAWIGFKAWEDAVKMIRRWSRSEDRARLKKCGVAVWILQPSLEGFCIVLCHILCLMKLCTRDLVHWPAGSRRA